MFPIYLAVTILAAAVNGCAAALDLLRSPMIVVSMDRAGVPHSWMTPLGLLKMTGAGGLLIGIVVPSIGIAAAAGLVLFFIGAIVTHVRGHFHEFMMPVSFLVLAIAALALRLITL
jgi:hypothetical protein